MRIHWSSLLIVFVYSNDILSETININIDIHTEPHVLAQKSCFGKRKSCYHLAYPLIMKEKEKLFGIPLEGWKYNEICRCNMPPQEQLQMIQFLHVPKTGTSINWFLHDYFDCLPNNASLPCMKWLVTRDEQLRGLCDGRLFSCMGHSVSPSLPDLVISDETYLVTMIRDPWKRIQSDFHYVQKKPSTGHLGPHINISHAISSASSILDYALYPGIANCATKMFNGLFCGDDIPLTHEHLVLAKRVLDHSLFVGITDFFRTSLCQFSWLYGGVVRSQHHQKSRAGNYTFLSFHSLSPKQKQLFRESERFDLELYRYALRKFSQQQSKIQCPIVEFEK